MKQLLLGCWFLSLPLLATEWPEIQFPDSATVEVVAEEMVYQGTPMATWVMRDKSNQMMTAAFFKRQWQGKSERFDEQMFGQDYIINSLQPPFLLTARIRKDFDGVLAYIGISKDPGSPVHSKLHFQCRAVALCCLMSVQRISSRVAEPWFSTATAHWQIPSITTNVTFNVRVGAKLVPIWIAKSAP